MTENTLRSSRRIYLFLQKPYAGLNRELVMPGYFAASLLRIASVR
jgi:hypothetical protein